MGKHMDSCYKELRGIVVSHTPPVCQDVVWLQPVKPGLFRWMVPTPYKNHTWMPVAVEQPIPKNALLEYFYDKVQENSSSPFKFYSESDTEALLGAYIYDENGNVSVQGVLNFHCDSDQEGENRTYFNQSVIDYEQEISTYIKQFYDKIILSVKSPDGEHSIEISTGEVLIDGAKIITISNINEYIEEYGVSSIKTETSSFTYEGSSYSLLKLTPTVATKGDVVITGNVNDSALLAFLNQAAAEGDILKHYEETFEENNGVPTENNTADINVKYSGVRGSISILAQKELESYLSTAPTDLTNYFHVPGVYSCLYTEDEDSADGYRTSVSTFPDYIKFVVDCSKQADNYYHNQVVMDKEKFHINQNLYVGGNTYLEGNTYFGGDIYIGDFHFDPNIFVNGLVNSVSATATKTGDYQILTLAASPTTEDVKITGGIDKDALVALINQLISSGDITPDTGTVETGKSYSGTVTVDNKVSMITGTITGNVNFAYSSLPDAKHETHFILESKGNYTVTFPSGYQVTDGNSSQSLDNGQWIEINYISDGNQIYVRSIINE